MTIQITNDTFGNAGREEVRFSDREDLKNHIHDLSTNSGWYREYLTGALDTCRDVGIGSPVESEDYMSLEQYEADLFTKAMLGAIETPRPSTKLVAEWSGKLTVGIYENCAWSIRLYEDRAIVRMPGVRWQGNTGGYHLYRSRLDRSAKGGVVKLNELIALRASELADDEDYTDTALDIVEGTYPRSNTLS